MSRQFTRDFLIEVEKGNIAGHSMVHKFGRSISIANGAWSHISMTPFSVANFRQSAISMRIKAGGNGADTAAGAGAREVTIEGIDSNFNELSEAVATAGAGASAATTATFWRVHRAWVSAVGTYTVANTGNVVIEDSGGGADFLTIVAGEGQTQYAGWTSSVGRTAYLLSIHVNVDSNKTTDIRVFTRANIDDIVAPMDSKRLRLFFDGMIGNFAYRPDGPELSIPEKTDIWLEGYGDGAASNATVDIELLIVDN